MDKFSRHIYADIPVNKRNFLASVVRIYPNPNIVVPVRAFFYDFNSILWTDSPGAYKRVFNRCLNIHSLSICPRTLWGGMRNKLSSNFVKNHLPSVGIYAIHNFKILIIGFIFSCNYDSLRFLILESHYVHIRILFHFLFPFRPGGLSVIPLLWLYNTTLSLICQQLFLRNYRKIINICLYFLRLVW